MSTTPVVAARLPVQPGAPGPADLRYAGLYLPTGKGSEPIAGDFYDVLTVGPDRIAIAVGDVAGHGAQALDAMRGLRYSVRALARQQVGPADLVARLDRLLADAGQEQYATLWFGVYQPSTAVLTCASAGHPPPALHTATGVALLAEADAPSLGTGLVRRTVAEHTQGLAPGAVLVAYSDGLIERRGADVDDQLTRLCHVVATACGAAPDASPEVIADEVLSAFLPRPSQAEDDVCVLVVRRESG